MNELTTSSIAPQGLINIGDMNPEAQVSITVEGYKQMCARIAELEAENAALKEAQRWIPVSERKPETKKDTLFLTFANGRVDARTWFWDARQFSCNEVTHWMPLPQPPEAE